MNNLVLFAALTFQFSVFIIYLLALTKTTIYKKEKRINFYNENIYIFYNHKDMPSVFGAENVFVSFTFNRNAIGLKTFLNGCKLKTNAQSNNKLSIPNE